MGALPSGTYEQRIAQDTGVLVAPVWWIQTDAGPSAPAGPYLWEASAWGYFPADALRDSFMLSVRLS